MAETFTFTLKTVHMDAPLIIQRLGIEEGGPVQRFIDSEVLRKCQPYVPMDTGMLIRSGILHTKIGSGEVKYRTPYARRWYYIPASFQGGSGKGTEALGRGNYWFERMKNKGGREAILRGAQKLSGAKLT